MIEPLNPLGHLLFDALKMMSMAVPLDNLGLAIPDGRFG